LDWLDKHTTQYFMPTHILSPYWIKQFKDEFTVEYLVDKANDNVQWNNDLVAAHMKQGRTFRQIVFDTTLTLNPLYCYCVALEEKDAALAESLIEKAREFLRNNPHYRLSNLSVIMPKEL
jgi:hypothetical protein